MLFHSPVHLSTRSKLGLILCQLLLIIYSIPVQADIQQRLSATVDQTSLDKARQMRMADKNRQTTRLNGISTRSMTKLSAQIRDSLEMNPNLRFRANAFTRVKSGKLLQVDILLAEASDQTIADLRAIGIMVEVINKELRRVQAWVTTDQLNQLGELDNVVIIQAPQYPRIRQGSRLTEGDTILGGNQVRNLGITGEGIRVGIISDGADDFQSAVASGDLPANLIRFGTCDFASTCNEGTAMAEIIHDIAPDAELAVGALGTSLDFIQRINQLANEFDADIIVDDIGFFGEPFFEDGPVAQAVNSLPDNIVYVSAAGNNADNHYEANFRAAPAPNQDIHDFGNNDPVLGFVIPARSSVTIFLQWNTPFSNPSSDYDLLVLDQNGDLLNASVADQLMPGVPPIEAVNIPNTSSVDQVAFVAINLFSGPEQRLEMFFLDSPGIEIPIAAGSIFGHPAVPKAIAVASINASEPGNDNIAFYSSNGPSRVDFPVRVDRPKPDLTAIDGVSVTGTGGFPSTFFGTSAAAPHVAGIAALLLSVSNRVTPSDVRQAMQNSAVDLGSTGQDSVYGFGRIDAFAARQLLRSPTISPILLLLDED